MRIFSNPKFWPVLVLAAAGLQPACSSTTPSDGDNDDGSRGSSCSATYSECGGVCIDLMGDGQNCSACGTACAQGQVCSAGTCQGSCSEAGTTQCGSSCVDLQTNPGHCGVCDSACSAGQHCQRGACVVGPMEGSGGAGTGGGTSFSTEVTLQEGELGQCEVDGVVEATN